MNYMSKWRFFGYNSITPWNELQHLYHHYADYLDMTSAVTKNLLGGNGRKGWGNVFLFFMYDRKLVAKASIKWVI